MQDKHFSVNSVTENSRGVKSEAEIPEPFGENKGIVINGYRKVREYYAFERQLKKIILILYHAP